MMLPEEILSVLKVAALSGGLALASSGCAMGATPAAQTTVYPDGTQVVYLPPDGTTSTPVTVTNQAPCPYVPGQATPPQNAPQPVATPAQPDPNQPTPSFHDPCPPCGMG